jgi:hypothetical protein
MSRACGEAIGLRIRICRFVAASGRCNGSNRPDQHNGFCPFTPQSRTRSTSNAISFPAIRSVLSDAKRFRIGGRRLRPEQEPSLRLSFGRSQVHVTIPLGPFVVDKAGAPAQAPPDEWRSLVGRSLPGLPRAPI